MFNKKSYRFTFILSKPADSYLEELYEEGCDDALFGVSNGTPYVDFDREATSLEEAINSARGDIEKIPGLKVLRIEGKDSV